MKSKHLFATPLCVGILSLGLVTSRAQTTAIWTGLSSGGEWNDLTWSTGKPPLDSTTNAVIGVGTNVSYNLPMAATSFGFLTNNGTLNINASGFNCGSVLMTALTAGGQKLFINSGGVATVSGVFGLGTNTAATLGSGASLTVSNLIIGYNTGNNTITANFTNNGGTLTVLKTTLNNLSSSTLAPLLVINGGVNNLGNTTIGRSHNSSVYTLGQDGLVIYGGTVTTTNLTVSGASFDSTYIAGGTVTNIGNVTITGATAGRYMRVVQSGGLFVVADPNIVYLNPTVAGAETARYQVTGGTNFIGGIYLGASNNAALATVTATVGGIVYVGSQGIATNGAVINTFTLNNGGLFGATADWADAVNMNLNGASSAFTFQTADPSGVPHNIAVSGILSGGGPAALVNKTGTGILTLNAANTYLGTTDIKQGIVALGANGALASTPVMVENGTVFDVSAVSGGYSLPAGKTLAGFGIVTGAVTVASGGIINPGSNTVNGTLTFSNSVTMNGNVTNHFDLLSTPGAGNDRVVVAGDLNANSLNYLEISGGFNGNTYALIQYGGTFNGDVVNNFTVVGSPGILSNSVTAKTIYLISSNTNRSAGNVTWAGNSSANDWNITSATTNWLFSGQLAYFLNGDTALFDNTGAANSSVNLAVSVSPASTTVNSSASYSITGTGSIDGSGSLTKSGVGTLAIDTANGYTGGTTINGGILEVGSLANGSSPSGIGASVSDPTTLILTNATLRYIGGTIAIDRAATLGGTAILDVTNSATALTISGALAGSGSLVTVGAGNLILSGGNSYGGGTILNAGTLTLNNASAAGSGPITFNGNSTLAIGAVVPANQIVLTNYSGLITGGNAGGATGINGVIGSSNLVLAVTTGVFDLKGNMAAYSGTVTFSNAGGAVVRLNGSIGSPLATWDLGAGPMDLNVRTSSTSNNIGALKGASGTTLSGRGGSSNNGGTTYYIGANGLSTLFDGAILNGTGGSSSTTSINKIGGGTLTLSGTSTYSGSTTISLGTLALTGAGSVAASATINIVAGATLDVSTLTTPTLAVGGNQTLQGRGTILGGVDSTGGLRIAPGGGVGGGLGTLTATNAIALGGTTWMKINRASTPNSDKLVSSLSNITYGGTLLVTNIGASLQVGDTFDLFDGGTPNSGTFATLQLPNYYTWDTSQLGVNGTVSVFAILPPPAITNVDFSTLSAGTIMLNAINGAPNGPVTVLTTENLALPVSSWTTVTTTTFDGSGNLNLAVTVDPALPQSYFLLKVY